VSYVIQEEGQILEYDGQRFECVGFQPYVRADASRARLAVMLTECPNCGAPFTIMIPVHAAQFYPRRRCDKHKRPGAKVKRKGRADVSVAPC
jgi:hypothetical protein